MTTITDLRPTEKRRVMDLVQEAGIDVSDWANYKGGAAKAAANPRYCYDWSFVDSAGPIVLNLWYDNLTPEQERIVVRDNLREARRRLAAIKGSSNRALRAAKMGDAIEQAWRTRSPLRVIVNEGKMRTSDAPEADRSRVKRRRLDDVAWSVGRYDWTSGACELVRGLIVHAAIDQFDLPEVGSLVVEQVDVNGKQYVRSAEVRRRVLQRAGDRCEHCQEPGFETGHGTVFLETHHIVPLSQGGPDTVSNVAAVCPNHHREAHHGTNAHAIRDRLLKVIASHAGAGAA